MEAISVSEFIKKDYGPKITWKYDKDYLSSYRDGKEMGYNINRNRCLTKEDQFMWIQPVSYTHLTLPTICSV